MPVAKQLAEMIERGSWIRRMFEEGERLKSERGADQVFDFSLGNPDLEPPAEVLAALREDVCDARSSHGYMPNAGYPAVREAVAAKLRRETGLEFTADDIVMTVGAAGACNVILKSILDPGDEVIVLRPFFPEYASYISNHSGRIVPVDTDETFLPDVERIAAAITPRTRAIMVNTPNNPTGRVYPAEVLRELDDMLSKLERPVLVISDEPYRELVFDGGEQTVVASVIGPTAICYSWSKSLAIPGERLGFLALSPLLPGREALRTACVFSNRMLGYVNAPAIWQRVVARALDARIDGSIYQRRRDLLCDALEKMGYSVTKPQGAFYVFLKTPIADDVSFVQRLAEQGVLAVPGVGFGRAGYVRLSLTVPDDMIRRSLPAFERALRASKV